ncbi:hypothetical protein F5ESL0233_02305 [Lactobacillus sp. ESL0233]|uniref:hypothetical protein n=1 Tax=Lactobacillus sp. ESL0233 TaxID=2069354 RepID=UPI000EFB5213|nr:hypothetical protein [Lactobacillus sp. ESL0233]RMC42158.1 hypothetical protein F5ESL0233_02305 [Lactobacillus sp. ESL0233]
MKKLQPQLTFIGRPFADQLLDEQRTFTQANLEMEQNEVFQSFLANNNLKAKRSNMIVFGPENFMYWYGVTVAKEIEVPQGLLRFVLPETQVAIKQQNNQNLSFFSQPLNVVVAQFLQEVRDEGIQTYENLGDSSMPYIVQDLNLNTKQLTQMLYLEADN